MKLMSDSAPRAVWLRLVAAAVVMIFPASGARGAGETVQLETKTGILYGTLDLPNGSGPFPAVLIVAGSGPTDRDGNSPGLKNDSLKLLGQALANRGIAALRYDKRWSGGSARSPREEELRIETFVSDAVEWISLLRRDARFKGICVLGHSEGSLIGMLAARQAKVSAFVSIAGSGRNAAEVIRDQLKGKLSPELNRESDRILAELGAGRSVTETPMDLAGLYRPSVQPFVISLLRYDPAGAIVALDAPVLIVQGTTDLQVTVADAKRLAAAKAGAKLALIDGMNHVLKHATTLAEQQAAYTDPSIPIEPRLVEAVAAFLAASMARDH
jgi:uncharacterized protein